MLVLHTELGEADVLANIIDSDENPEILGTVAGADTLLVICKDAVVAERLESEFHWWTLLIRISKKPKKS